MLAEPGQQMANVAADVSDAIGRPLGPATMFTGVAISLFCPGAVASLGDRIANPGAVSSFLPMLGFGHPLAIGRDFLEAEGTLGREQVVILRYSLWQERFGGSRFRIHIRPPLEFSPTGNHERDVYLLTCAINDMIEKMVRERPAMWLWIHRRWPTAREQDRLRDWRGQELKSDAAA